MARCGRWGVRASSRIFGTTPAVETVTRLGTMWSPSSSDITRKAFIRGSKARKGSPAPIATRFVPRGVLPATPYASFRATTICSTISPAVSVRSRPSFAVRQKSHWSGQPDCEEKQMVSRRSSGMNTVSTGRPSRVFMRYRRVPSSAT